MFAELWIALRKARERQVAARLSRTEFEARRLDRFRLLVRHAQRRSPYYRRIMAERGIDSSTCLPTDFPPLTKSLLMQHFDAIVTVPGIRKSDVAAFLTTSHDPAERYRDRYRVLHTSGSSGEVGYFVYSSRDWARASPGRPVGHMPARKGKGKFRFAFYGAVGGHYAGVTFAQSIATGPMRWFVNVGLFEVNRSLAETVAALNAFQPEFISGYTTALKMLGGEQRRGTLRLKNLIGMTTAGEVATPADLAYLSTAFGCEVFNNYGSSEHLSMGTSLPGEPNIVLFDHDLIFELFDDHTLVTNLFNYTQPLIRYRMPDVLRPAQSQAHAPHLVVESIIGRSEQQPTFVNRDGATDAISAFSIAALFAPGVTRFQLHLTGETAFRLLVCLESGLDEAAQRTALAAMAEQLRKLLASRRMENVTFEVAPVEDIAINPRTRKFQLIVDQRRDLPR